MRIDRIASSEVSPIRLAGLFAATVIIRNLLEAASLGSVFTAPAFVFHFPIAYVFPMTGLAGLLHILSGYPLGKLLRLMVFAWTLTLLPPLLDFLIGTTSSIGYFPLEKSNAGFFLINFFNPSVSLPGTTAGIRIEAAIGCLLAGVFTAAVAEGRRVFRGVVTALVFAPVFLVFFTWPYLIYVLFSDLFPWANGVQVFMQWHAVTEAPLTGAAHYTIFLVDVFPVLLISGWFLSILRPDEWRRAIAFLRIHWGGFLIPITGGVLAAAAAVSSGTATFADVVSFCGAATAAILILISRAFRGNYRLGSIMVALLVAAASGWVPFVLTGLAAALSIISGPRQLSSMLLYPVLLLTAASSASIAFASPIPILILAASLLAGLFDDRRTVVLAAGSVILIAAFLFPTDPGSAFLSGQARTTDTFNRSSRVAYGLVSAGSETAAGGGFLRLAETAHLLGMGDRAWWAYSVATIRGDSSPEMLKVGLNLSFIEGDDEQFMELMDRYMTSSDTPDMDGLVSILMAQAARDGNTTRLEKLHGLLGASPGLFQAYSRIYFSRGDTSGAISYSETALQVPGASTSHYAWAIDLSALSGGDYDRVFRMGFERFPGSVELMTSRLRAAVTAGDEPDRRDLLTRCLTLRPSSKEVLETASMWLLASGKPDSALVYSERALATDLRPELRTFLLSCQCALLAGELELLEANCRYGLSLYPETPALLCYLEESNPLLDSLCQPR